MSKEFGTKMMLFGGKSLVGQLLRVNFRGAETKVVIRVFIYFGQLGNFRTYVGEHKDCVLCCPVRTLMDPRVGGAR